MEIPKIRVKTEGFRAIGSADIIIDGITVVSGENGCGKSTLSKLLYYLYKTATNYDLLVADSFRLKFRNLSEVLEAAIRDLDMYFLDRKESDKEEKIGLREEITKLRRGLGNYPLSDSDKEQWLSIIERIASAFTEYTEKEGRLFKRPSNRRIRYALNEFFGEKEAKKYSDDEEQPIPWDRIIEFVESIFKEAKEKMDLRPVSVFNDSFRKNFNDSKLPQTFEVFELEEQIISIKADNLASPFLIKNTIYIDTPMSIGADSETEYWDDLNVLLRKPNDGQERNIARLISEDIISGEVAREDGPFANRFQYKRTDGAVFNLKDVATGIKAFGIIELLLNNGSLNNKTLLIIDEPESNLHPQWIIEYARLIVLLHKQIGVKFFIASHNPDMISALKYISAKQEIEEDVNFYIAEKTAPRHYQYNYKHLGTDIDPIFASFNIALDRINAYGI